MHEATVESSSETDGPESTRNVPMSQFWVKIDRI